MYQILLVEDDEVDQMNVNRAFRKAGIVNPMLVANNGLEALELIRGGNVRKPLIILLDLNMPLMGGIEFLRHLRREEGWKHTPVVILTSSKEEQDKVEVFNLNVQGYIIKPVDQEVFLDAVGRIGNYWSINEFPEGV